VNAHGLIKVRVFSDDRATREAIFSTLSDELGAAPIQHIGKLLVLWRPMPPKEKVEREGRGAGPKVVKILKFSKSGNHEPRSRRSRSWATCASRPAANSSARPSAAPASRSLRKQN